MTPFWVAAYLDARTVTFSAMRFETVSLCDKAVTFLIRVFEIVVPPRQAGLLSNRTTFRISSTDMDIVGHFEGFTAALRLRVLWHPQNNQLFARKCRVRELVVAAAAAAVAVEVGEERVVWSDSEKKDEQPGDGRR